MDATEPRCKIKPSLSTHFHLKESISALQEKFELQNGEDCTRGRGWKSVDTIMILWRENVKRPLDVGQEILDVLISQQRHEFKVFSRKIRFHTTQSSEYHLISIGRPGTSRGRNRSRHCQLRRQSRPCKGLVKAIEGVDAVLSFIITLDDYANRALETLINACMEAGVRRFAPSEWETRSHCGIQAYWVSGRDKQEEEGLMI